MTERVQGRHFAAMAPTWVTRYETRPSFQARLQIVGAAMERHLGSADRVLDFGSGAGIFSLIASALAREVTALDPSPEMQASAVSEMDRAIQLVRTYGWSPQPARIRRITGSLDAVDAAPGRFDAVLAISVFEYLADPSGTLVALRNLLRPEGTTLLSLPEPGTLWRRSELLLNGTLARIGRRTHIDRLSDRSYTASWPSGSLDPAHLGIHRLQVRERIALPLGTGGWRERVRPSTLWVLRCP